MMCCSIKLNRATRCDKQLTPQTIVMETEVNKDYIDSGLFDNWFHYSKAYLNCSHHFLFDPRDDFTRSYIEKFEFGNLRYSFVGEDFDGVPAKNMWRHHPDFEKKPNKRSEGYGSAMFKDATQRRPLNLKAIVDRGHIAFHFDLDTVWQSDPFIQFDKAGVHDVILTSDAGISTNDRLLCTCVIFLRPSAGARDFVDRWSAEISSKDMEDQKPANRVLAKMTNLDKVVLPIEEFPPGLTADKYPKATILHANYMKGTAKKVQFFKSRGLWVGRQ